MAVAHVDVPANPTLAKRFRDSVKGFPTLLLFRDRKMYRYSGQRTPEAMAAFARSGYKQATQLDVPPVPGMLDGLFGAVLGTVERNAKGIIAGCVCLLLGSLLHATLLVRRNTGKRRTGPPAGAAAAAKKVK